MVEVWLRGSRIVERWLKGIGVASPDAFTKCSADCSLRPIRISSQRPENSRFHLKPLLAFAGGCSLPASGVIRTAGKPKSLRVRELTDDDSEADLCLSGVGFSSMIRGTSLEGEETLLGSRGDAALASEW